MQYYRYMERHYLDLLIQEGVIRVTTMHTCRALENQELSDINEGKGTGNTAIKDQLVNDNNLPGLFNDTFKLEDSSMRFIDVDVTRHITLKDLYIYCMTNKPSKENMEKAGYDCCFEIIDLDSFASEISIALYKKGLSRTPHFLKPECLYLEERKIIVNNMTDIDKLAWTKDPRFSHQKESRLIFNSRLDFTINPINLIIPNLNKFIREVKFRENGETY